jgi:hypothetical protein
VRECKGNDQMVWRTLNPDNDEEPPSLMAMAWIDKKGKKTGSGTIVRLLTNLPVDPERWVEERKVKNFGAGQKSVREKRIPELVSLYRTTMNCVDRTNAHSMRALKPNKSVKVSMRCLLGLPR